MRRPLKSYEAPLSGDREITVTDHAVLRYLERVEGIDIEEIRKRIVGEGSLCWLTYHLGGTGLFPVADAENGSSPPHRVRMIDYKVVTVLPATGSDDAD